MRYRAVLRPTGGVLVVLVGYMVAAVFGLALNMASAGHRWPGPLDEVRRHPWAAFMLFGLFGAVLAVAQARLGTSATHIPVPEQVERATRLLAGQVLGQRLDDIAAWQLDRPALNTAWRWKPARPGPSSPGRLWWSGDRPGEADAMAELADWFAASPQRRLAILGDGGMGKTSLTLLLVRHLAKAATPGEPVPVLFSAADWDARTEELDAWLARRLSEDYPSLRGAEFGRDMPWVLVRQRRILPVLDGLDELPDSQRDAAVHALGRSATNDNPLILTCRTKTYQADRTGTRASIDATLTAEPLPPETAIGFIEAFSSDRRRWQAVLDQLADAPEGRLAGALASPLVLWLLRVTYLETGRDPMPLLDTARLPSSTAIRDHLLEELIPALIDTRRPARHVDPESFRPRRRWAPADARRWLEFIAVHLTEQGTSDLAWWRLPAAWPLTGSGVAARIWGGFAGALFIGLFVMFMASPATVRPVVQEPSLLVAAEHLAVLMLIGAAAGALLGSELLDKQMLGLGAPAFASLRPHGRLRALARSMLLGLAAGLPAGLLLGAFGAMTDTGAFTHLWVGLERGLAAGAMLGVVFGTLAWAVHSAAVGDAGNPGALLRSDRRLVTIAALGGTATFWAVWGPATAPGGLFLAVCYGVFGRAWLGYALTKCSLATDRRVPFRLMSFLHDMHKIGVLRTTGVVYQFRHIELQRRLAAGASAPALIATAATVEYYRTLPHRTNKAVARANSRQLIPRLRVGGVDPATAYQPELAQALSAFARIRAACHQELPRALEAAEEAAGIYRRLAANEPALYRDALRDTLSTTADLLNQLGRAAEAQITLEQLAADGED